MPKQKPCQHTLLALDVSPHGRSSGFVRPPSDKRLVAATTKVKAERKEDHPLSTFPAPLVLPGDDLDINPRYPSQSLQSWLRLKDRNDVTDPRNIIYVVGPPNISLDASFMKDWAEPKVAPTAVPSSISSSMEKLDVGDVASYVGAFYCGLESIRLPSESLKFTIWEDTEVARGGKSSKAKHSKQGHAKSNHSFVGLQTSSECIRIRTRASKDGIYSFQLNLDDLLDVAIGMLPEDAYALLMLVEHDLYEDEDDVFVCGRAYGGSRVAVVSMARYHPLLDAQAGIDVDHAWPASHCERYINRCCHGSSFDAADNTDSSPTPSSAANAALILDDEDPSPIESAILAHRSLPCPSSDSSLTGLWLARVCRTASHELGHCFGMDHCVYYACAMQGSASIQEDSRQPPYACPVDEAKILRATGGEGAQRNRALVEFCRRHPTVHMFAALGAWLEKLLDD